MIDEHLLEVYHIMDIIEDLIYNSFNVESVDFKPFKKQFFEDICHDHFHPSKYSNILDLEKH